MSENMEGNNLNKPPSAMLNILMNLKTKAEIHLHIKDKDQIIFRS